ncbi:MAG TPA: dTDP-4-dehydrorhamnose reductase [Mycobacterium sp.]|nr:dTDP-4-dehydrorhamnose reductase [Mycobacterium sp.]
MSSRIVVTGAGGQVGSFLAARAAGEGREVLALTSAQWDITDAAAAGRIVQPGDVVINCAAYTDVDGAESDQQAALAVNVTGPGQIAAACARVGARLIHISTDYVFSGDFGGAQPRPYEPDDETGPLSVYGRTKLAGEAAVLAAAPDATVVRTAWVYTGAAGGDFVATMRSLAAGGDTVAVVDDQIGSPTYVADLTGALLQVADGRMTRRVLHAANRGAASRYQQACAVFAEVGADPERVRPVSSADRPRAASRPRYSALSSVESERAGLAPLPEWRSALAAALADVLPDPRCPPG